MVLVYDDIFLYFSRMAIGFYIGFKSQLVEGDKTTTLTILLASELNSNERVNWFTRLKERVRAAWLLMI